MSDHEGNGTVLAETVSKNGDDQQSRERSGTSSPSGRSGTPVSVTSDSSRRRIEQDTVKEPVARSRSPKSSRKRRRTRSRSRSRSRGRSASPKYSRRRSRTPKRSRSRSRSRRRSRSRGRDGHRNGDRHRTSRRSRSPPQYDQRRNRRNTERDNPKPSRCVGVFGLSTRTKERDLQSEFERYGPLDNIQLIHDHKSGRSRGFGFIYYTYLEDAQKAREGANGMNLDDRKIRVDFSLTDRNRSPPRRDKRSRSPERRRRSRSRSYRD